MSSDIAIKDRPRVDSNHHDLWFSKAAASKAAAFNNGNTLPTRPLGLHHMPLVAQVPSGEKKKSTTVEDV